MKYIPKISDDKKKYLGSCAYTKKDALIDQLIDKVNEQTREIEQLRNLINNMARKQDFPV